MCGGGFYLPPAVAERAWDAFWELDGTRRGSDYIFFGITHADILAYEQIHEIRLRPWERRIVLAMDRNRLEYLNRDRDREGDGDTASREMSAGLFDALFS